MSRNCKDIVNFEYEIPIIRLFMKKSVKKCKFFLVFIDFFIAKVVV